MRRRNSVGVYSQSFVCRPGVPVGPPASARSTRGPGGRVATATLCVKLINRGQDTGL